MNTKITPQHLSKPAYIYIRQSTLAQVRHHQESTERQYALREKALALGWPPTAVRIMDRDLGQSGAQMTGREDFKTLVADVSMGQVGAVFALEVSRLARSNLDWHRLLELCALTHTLVIDADGCYDPGDFNDGLLLGLKGTMAQAELHFLRGRLQGGKLNKAQKGELRFPLPVGLCYDDDSRIVVDPDDEVRGAVQLAFRLFQETGSAYAVVKRFAEDGLRFPKRAYGGAWAGRLIWGRLSHERVLGLIRNPSYAGVYVNIPRQSKQGFHGKKNTNSTAKLMPIPRQKEQGFHAIANRISGWRRRGSTVARSTVLSGVPNGECQVDHAQNQGSAAAAFRVRPQPEGDRRCGRRLDNNGVALPAPHAAGGAGLATAAGIADGRHGA
ncbi:recombinase family protein [Paraburkholderia sediminicola]|uniref:recombinase family protein n=1 Tax=Paraburkholderia sediminicola TaxID=458836 RepID=UPI0038B92A84